MARFTLWRRLRERVGRWRGTNIEFDLRGYAPLVEAMTKLEAGLERLDDERLRHRALQLRNAVAGGDSLDERLVDCFAVAREAARRTIGQRPYAVQLMAAIAMHRGCLAEMPTGEGKTLAAVMPVALNAMLGRGAHVLTFNDYLARRDAAWMAPIYEFLGLSVGIVQAAMDPRQRRAAYRSDVTYLTAKEAGFDYLRDGLCVDPTQLVHRDFCYALIDEADSILIDEARVPLVIAGSLDHPEGELEALAALVRGLDVGDYETEENNRAVHLTDAGLRRAERAIGRGSMMGADNWQRLAQLNCALHAEILLRCDVDYIVRQGRVEHVDEFTGRVVRDRLWPDGLQAALEAKEGVRLQRQGRVLGSITLQHFLRRYGKLAGMTATAQVGAEETRRFYDLGVVVVPAHRPVVRVDHADVVFTHLDAKLDALVEEIERVHESGRPVLVGTASVGESERLAARLRRAGTDCAVLNARTNELEAEIVADAGALGAVTISTNMAGRGTDIRLGGADERDAQRVVALGGLYVLGTNRHESVRIDDQLRGRSGRQGDPGSSRLYVSLEDDLFVRHRLEGALPAGLVPERQAEPIDSKIVRAEIARGQRIVEGQSFEIRKTLWEYSSLLEQQRAIVRKRRDELLQGAASVEVLERCDRQLHARLLAAVGAVELQRAERLVTLFHIDETWAEHLADVADVREGIHLMRVGGRNPMAAFHQRITDAFLRLPGRIEARVVETLERIQIVDGVIDLDSAGLARPASTWTYLINDDPFRDALVNALSGGGGFAVGAALYWPLLVLWEMARRRARRRR